MAAASREMKKDKGRGVVGCGGVRFWAGQVVFGPKRRFPSPFSFSNLNFYLF